MTPRPLPDRQHRPTTLADGCTADLGHQLAPTAPGQGLSQERFALEYGFDRTYISGIERGERNPTVLIVERLAGALGVATAELFNGG